MINALLEHVPIKMEVKDNEEEAKRNDLAKDDMAVEMAIDDDKIDETDEELEEDEEDDEEEESDTESDALEIEQAAVMLMSSDEEAELEAQRIRFPDISNTKKSSKDSLKSSRSSSRNSQSSNSSSKPQFTKESSPIKESFEESHKKQRISPRLKNSENNKTLESLNIENNNNNSNKLSTQILAKAKTEQQKLENNKTLEINKNKQDETSKSLDNNKNSENNRNKDNLPKSPANQAGLKSRRGSDNSTCSVASTVASDSAETESCGNIYVFNLQQKLIFNCEFCDIKYGDLENFGRHLHETHKLFHLDEDHEKENAPRNLSKTINISKNKTSKPSATNVKKEPLSCFDTLAEPPVALPPSVLAEPLDSCGNVFMLNHRKLFLVCGYCECKYANLDLFEKHLRQQHRIFEGCRNEVNVVPKVEVKEEVFIITEMVDKTDKIPPQVMVAIPAEIPLDISINEENSTETPVNAEDIMETVEEISNLEPTETASVLDSNILETSLVKEPEMPIIISKVSDAKGVEILSEIEVTEKTSIKKTRSKRRSSPEKPLESPNKRPKRITRNNTKVEEKPPLASIEEKPSEKTPESAQIIKAVAISDTLKSAKTEEITVDFVIPTESQKDPLLEVLETKETKDTAKPTDSEITTPLKTYETRETRKSAQIKKLINTEETKETKQQPTKTKVNKSKIKTRKDSKIVETPRTKSTRNSTKSSETNHFETEKSVVVRKPEIKTITVKKSKLKCSTCSKQFKRSDTLKTHERTHAAERAFVCDVCNKSFKAQTNLYMHKRFHLGDAYKNYKCQFCEKKFFRNTDRKVHELTHTGEKRFECGICDRGYASQSNIKKHIEKNHGKDAEANIKKIPKEKVKETVQKTKLNEDDHNMDDLSTDPVDDIIKQLQNEMQPRHDPESNAVTFTINTLACSEDLNKTLEITNQQNDEIDTTEKDVKPTLLQIVKRFMCDLCNRTFEKHIRLVEHRRLHTGEKPFGCDICGKHFRIRMRLNEHKQRHSSEKKFKCEICQLACCTKQDLNLHMRHHTNDRRYQCNMCPKAFVRSSDLKIHVRIHTGEKPYVCDICHKCFRANQNLSVHKKSHMGEASKTYKCEHCDKKFMRNIDRKVHMRSHTGEKPFKCEICNKGYSSKFNVRTHIERDHVSANGVGPPPRGKKKPGPKPKALRAELEKQKQLIQELQHQLLQQIKTDEKVIYAEDELLTEHNTLEPTPSLLSSSSKTDPIQSAYELLDKLKSSATTTSKPLTIIPSPPPLAEPNSDPFSKAKKDSSTVLPLSITQKLEQHSPLPSSTSSSTSCLTTPSPPKTTATKVVSQKTSLGIQQVSVTVSMQVENVPAEPTTSEKENAGILTSSSSSTTSVKKERKITSYFTVVGQKGEV